MSKPQFHIWPMSESDAAAVCEWRYPAPYEQFRWPSWRAMTRDGKEFGDPEIRRRQYVSVCDENSALVGYAQFFPLEGVVRLGMGMRPDRCGQGGGAAFARAIALEAGSRYPGTQIDLEVETWNTRAVRAYEKAGFKVADQYSRQAAHGEVDVYCMVFCG
ncbi:Acetyltransferase (GNAT) domain-containing protein [Cohnella sp. OV330]|uniref:GNAT family N-acetyltransferase n=1 Tax=Cohnella sp. OV330 TaxID=1855288 RepID=UPI0008EBEBA6|nr:GNAT family N-acetyltransferase [Cohnella sp. OV330]SFB59905.1 Acetyltransferase (GNAT) domain-containing protein [Cohnella sp. OV330]